MRRVGDQPTNPGPGVQIFGWQDFDNLWLALARLSHLERLLVMLDDTVHGAEADAEPSCDRRAVLASEAERQDARGAPRRNAVALRRQHVSARQKRKENKKGSREREMKKRDEKRRKGLH